VGISPADPLPVARAVRAEPVEIHYAPEEDLEAIDVAIIGSAQNAIDMDAYVLSDRAMIRAIAAAGARGVKVRQFKIALHGRRCWAGGRND